MPLQQALRHLDRAFRNFFDGRARYPAFQKKHGRQAATYATNAFRWDADDARPDAGEDGGAAGHSLVALLHWHAHHRHDLAKTRRDATSSRSWSRKILSSCPPSSATVGVDVGLKDVAVLSTGEKIANPQPSAPQ